MADHVFWKKGDTGLPDVLTDRNGDITLGMCKVCGQAAADLADSCPIIPADKWPEGADRHCWDANGLGFFYGPPRARVQVWLPVVKLSNIPTPAGHDWRVPVMRPSAPAIDLEQFRDVVEFWISETEKLRDTGPKRGLETYGNRLLALIDGQTKCPTCSGHGLIGSAGADAGSGCGEACPACNTEQPAKGEGSDGNHRDSRRARHSSIPDGQNQG